MPFLDSSQPTLSGAKGCGLILTRCRCGSVENEARSGLWGDPVRARVILGYRCLIALR